jgi:Phage tail lysozyme
MSRERVPERRSPAGSRAPGRDSSRPALPAAVLRLQRAAGNAAVRRLLQREPDEDKDWSSIPETERMAHVMALLVETHGYPENGAAGLVGNLYEESGLIPNRVEGSKVSDPMRAKDHAGDVQDFTADEIMDRKAGKSGPKKPGIGLAQWTTKERRAGLFENGSDILFDMDGQVSYLVDELGRSYRKLDKNLKQHDVTVDDASDDVVYMFEIPGSILEEIEVTTKDGKTKKKRVKRKRTDPEVVTVFERRRKSGHRALAAYQASKAASTPTGP